MNIDRAYIGIRTVVELLIVPIVAYGVIILSDMRKTIDELNTRVAVLLTENSVAKDTIKDHELRIRVLEGRK